MSQQLYTPSDDDFYGRSIATFIVPQSMRSTELISQDSREEPIQVILNACDAGSVQYEASNAENVKSRISKVDAEVILSKSSIADKSDTKEPTRAGASNPSSPKHNQPSRQANHLECMEPETRRT